MTGNSDSGHTIRIYCDFDGTVVEHDVGDAFFERFAGAEMWKDNVLFEEGRITSKELFERHESKISSIGHGSFEDFCSSFAVLPSFTGFTRWCSERDIALTIVSDGLDRYIHSILDRSGISLPVYANSLELRQDGTCSISRPYADSECSSCGMCKRNIMLTNSADEDYIVLIGNGLSDYCPATYADLVFAKGKLESYCQEKNISFRKFHTFNEISSVLGDLLQKKKLRRPKRAEILRKSLWTRG